MAKFDGVTALLCILLTQTVGSFCHAAHNNDLVRHVGK